MTSFACSQHAWDTLFTELDQCVDPVSFWWRDDDITTSTPALATLKHLSVQTNIPIALSAIPAYVTDTVGETLSTWKQATVLQHGYDHNNYALPHHKKSEFPCYRSFLDMFSALEKGRTKLSAIFGSCVVWILVPPWNRLCWNLVPLLRHHGYVGLSCLHSTKTHKTTDNVFQIHTHIDIMDWKTRTFIGETATLTQVVEQLRIRRKNHPQTKPIGLLTHHWIHTEDIWSFLWRFMTHMSCHASVRWLSVPCILRSVC